MASFMEEPTLLKDFALNENSHTTYTIGLPLRSPILCLSVLCSKSIRLNDR